MQRLAPLAVRLLMAASAIRSRQEGLRLNETAAFRGQIAWSRHFFRSEAETIRGAYFGGVVLPVLVLILPLCPGCNQKTTAQAGECGSRHNPAADPEPHRNPLLVQLKVHPVYQTPGHHRNRHGKLNEMSAAGDAMA